jgi:L-malate glycosyltransferase
MEYLEGFKGELILLNNAQSEHPYLSTGDRSRVLAFYQRAKHIFFVSQRNLHVTERALLQRLNNASVIHYPVMDSLPDFDWPAASQAKFISVARYDVYDKGFDLLLPALRELITHSLPWTLSFFGRGKDEAYLREAIRYYGLEERVSLRGFVEDISRVYAEHHMLLLPSRIEGCALAMTEALLRGRPVLATDVAAVPEWIIHGFNGYICPHLTEQAIYESVKNALDHQGEWKMLGLQALNSAWGQYRPNDHKKLIE